MRQSGFTLLELSIVLVIIGLIIGGVTVGSQLIRLAEVRTVASDLDEYKTAINTFRLKYRSLPGDLNNATSYWGAANNNATTCKTTVGSGTATCNGDGNGEVTTNDQSGTLYEAFRFWQHLANANMVGGSFNGVAGPGGTWHHQAGVNSPGGSINGSGYSFYSIGTAIVNTTLSWLAPSKGHILLFGSTTPDEDPYLPIVNGPEAASVDQKVDDGKPGTGSLLSFLDTPCSTSTSPATAQYNVSATEAACIMIFLIK